MNQAKQTLRDALGNPTTSEDHRKQLQKELEALELLLVQRDVNRIRLLTHGPQPSHSQVGRGLAEAPPSSSAQCEFERRSA